MQSIQDDTEDRAMYSHAVRTATDLIPTEYDTENRVILQTSPMRTGMNEFSIYYVLLLWDENEGGKLELRRRTTPKGYKDDVLGTIDDNGKTLQQAAKLMADYL